MNTAPGDLDTWRQDIAEAVCRARIYCETADMYASIGDDAGLDHAIRCLVANTRHAVSVLGDLKADKARLRAARAAEAAA